MKTFKSFLLDQINEVEKPKAKGEKDFFDAHKVDVADPEDQGANSAKVTTKERSGKRPADRLDNKQKLDETPKVDQGLSGKQKVAARAARGDNSPGFKIGNTTGGTWRGKDSPSPYKDSNVAKSGERKGLITKSAIQKTKDQIKSRLNKEEKAYATIKAKAKNEEHEVLLIALYDELHENNKNALLEKLEEDYDRLIEFAKSVAEE